MKRPVISLILAEFIGTFFLVFLGCGAIIVDQAESIPLIFGGVVMVMIYAVGHISGAHFNPAVTFSFWLNKKFPGKRVGLYLMAQFTGAIMASLFHYWLFPESSGYGATAPAISLGPAFALELLLTFLLMFVIMSVATDSRAVGEMAGLAIGMTVALGAWVGGPLTGASMNPARSLGPALVSGDFSSLWLYFLAPLLGAALGGWVYECLKCDRDQGPDDLTCC